jgi:hypothetical protein
MSPIVRTFGQNTTQSRILTAVANAEGVSAMSTTAWLDGTKGRNRERKFLNGQDYFRCLLSCALADFDLALSASENLAASRHGEIPCFQPLVCCPVATWLVDFSCLHTKELWGSANWQGKNNGASVNSIRLCGIQRFESFPLMPLHNNYAVLTD